MGLLLCYNAVARGGVAKLQKDQTPFLIANHCIAHRLAVATHQTKYMYIPYLKKLNSNTLLQVSSSFKMF